MAAVYPWPPRQRRGVLGDAGATSPESPQTSEFTEGSGPQTEASPVKHTTKDKISRGAESSLPVKFRRPCHWAHRPLIIRYRQLRFQCSQCHTGPKKPCTCTRAEITGAGHKASGEHQTQGMTEHQHR